MYRLYKVKKYRDQLFKQIQKDYSLFGQLRLIMYNFQIKVEIFGCTQIFSLDLSYYIEGYLIYKNYIFKNII